MRNNRWRTLLVSFSTVFTLAACGSTGAESNSETTASASGGKDTLYIGMTNSPDSFNPMNTPGVAGKWTLRFIYDTLLSMPEPLTFEENMSDQFETTDNQNYTIHLKEGMTWTDGEPITAEDVIFTLNLIAEPTLESTEGTSVSFLPGVSTSGKFEEGVTEIPDLVAVDEYTVTFKTDVPTDPNFVQEMIGFDVYILPEHVLADVDPAAIGTSEFATSPTVTSGPYTFVEYENNSYVELAANPTYHKGEANIGSIFIRVMNGTNLVTEFESGGIDMAAGGGIGVVPISDLTILENNENISLEENSSWSGQFMLINNDKYTNTAFRQALVYAIDRETIVDQLLQGKGDVITGLYTYASPYRNEELDPVPFDTEKAKELLAESGYDTSVPITLTVPTGNKVREQSASLIEQNLEAIGLQVEQVTYDFPTTLANAKEGNYELALMGYAFQVDPDVSMYAKSTGTSNYSRMNDSKLDELLAEGTTLTSQDDRKEVYDEFQVYMQEQAFIVPLYSDSQFGVRSQNLSGGIKEFWLGSLYDVSEWSFE